ncbi:MAG: hypothetical protein ABR564_06265 [Candidatus Dormibacteria bacterium]
MTSAPATGDLGAAREESGKVVAVEHLEGGLIELTARLVHLAATARPGQFAQLRCGPWGQPLLRRPFSVAWTSAECCSFVFAAGGEGTRRLAALRPGDELDALGPLGHGFTVDGSVRRAVCVAGGLGCAPFPLLVRELRRAGVAEVVVLSGASCGDRLYPAERFRRGDTEVEVREVTVDGSRGAAGLVTELVPAASRAPGTAAIYGCGPNPMLGALHGVLADEPASAVREVSLEAPMGCGFGT